jgi:PilZ domain
MASAGREVSVFGTDTVGKPFFQTARAVSVSGFEVTLEGLDRVLDVNNVVGVRHAGQKARFQVVWVGKAGTPEQGQIGLRALELERDIWKQEARRPAAAPASHPAVAGRERRRYPRIWCQGRVEFRQKGAQDPILGRLQVLGEGGCYIQTLTAAPELSELDLRVNAEDLELRASAVVRDSRAGFGMGVEFGPIHPAHLARLQEWVSRHFVGKAAER